ncbi:hypothetical protein Pcinc_032439 [Petrolisthes cinctipes]|uniref:Uncharacterized protein n=1 Tax=Petrolisthes cinctipes TaxID=88211 RepID=A0AAE1JZ74_PETCI|nr:hypothetical protein Pcinc_032439 [Petrolisthes cinctipes]
MCVVYCASYHCVRPYSTAQQHHKPPQRNLLSVTNYTPYRNIAGVTHNLNTHPFPGTATVPADLMVVLAGNNVVDETRKEKSAAVMLGEKRPNNFLWLTALVQPFPTTPPPPPLPPPPPQPLPL